MFLCYLCWVNEVKRKADGWEARFQVGNLVPTLSAENAEKGWGTHLVGRGTIFELDATCSVRSGGKVRASPLLHHSDLKFYILLTKSPRGFPRLGVREEMRIYKSGLWPKRLAFGLVAIVFLGAFSQAQNTPLADVAVEYSPLYILKGYTIWMNGGSGSFAFNANDWFGVAGDVGGYLGHIPQSLTGETYSFGPRFSYRKLDRVVPFAQALFGGSHFSESSGGITGGGTQFTFALGGGADIGLGSSRKYALRLESDYFGIRSSGSTTPALRLGVGIVYRIGNK